MRRAHKYNVPFAPFCACPPLFFYLRSATRSAPLSLVRLFRTLAGWMGELRAPKHENYGTSPPPWHPHSDDTLADIGAGSLKPIHLSDPAALLPPPLTSLADLETDALAYVLACLVPADLARTAASARRLHEAVEAATDLRASRLGACLAPFRGSARLELLAIKETVKHEQQSMRTRPRV